VSVCPEPGQLVLLIGELLEEWSEGAVAATRHRVTLPPPPPSFLPPTPCSDVSDMAAQTTSLHSSPLTYSDVSGVLTSPRQSAVFFATPPEQMVVGVGGGTTYAQWRKKRVKRVIKVLRAGAGAAQ
jgi:hypothetical protein